MSVRRITAVLGSIAALTLTLVAAAPAAAAESRHRTVEATAVLSGSQEVPPRETPAGGVAVIKIRPHAGKVCFALAVVRLTTPATAAHIHRGAVGVNGPIVVDFGRNLPDPHFSRGCVATGRELAQEIADNLAGFYVNVHTTTFPGGEIRGQLV